jgi:hypothetical protein
MCLLMIIDNLDIDRSGRAFRPFKANPPLVIDANAVLTLTVALQPFRPVTGQRSEVFQARCSVQPVRPIFSLPGKTGELPNDVAIGKTLGTLIPVADDHRSQSTHNYALRKA